MPESAGIAVDGSAHPAGNARQRFYAFESALDAEIHQRLKIGAGVRGHDRAFGANRVGGKAQDNARETLVGSNQVRPAANDDGGMSAPASRAQGRDEALRAGAFSQDSRRPADPEAGIVRQGNVLRNVESGNGGEHPPNYERHPTRKSPSPSILTYNKDRTAMPSLDRITRNPEIMGGKPCLRGMRVTVGVIVGLVASGRTHAEILAAYPYLQEEDIRQALAYAAWRVEEVEVPLPAA